MQLAVVKNLEAHVLTPNDARSWALMPSAMVRVGAFCKKYDSDADPEMMVAQCMAAFVNPVAGVHVILLLEDGVAIGHMLVAFEHWFGTDMATIIQLESDKPIPRQLAKRTMDFVDQWARARGAKFLQAMARNKKVARAFSIFHGFEEQRVMMRKSLDISLSTGVAGEGGNQLELGTQVSQSTQREH